MLDSGPTTPGISLQEKQLDYLIYDDRLDGSRPKGNFWSMQVGEDTPITTAVQRTIARANLSGGGKIRTLILMCHGIEDNGIGGYGLLFCNEDLTQNTVHMLSPLKGKLEKIVLLACSAAHTAVQGGEGDGELLCKRMARATGAWVKASTYRQEYVTWSLSKGFGNDFGDFEGDCWWFDPSGTRKYKADLTTW